MPSALLAMRHMNAKKIDLHVATLQPAEQRALSEVQGAPSAEKKEPASDNSNGKPQFTIECKLISGTATDGEVIFTMPRLMIEDRAPADFIIGSLVPFPEELSLEPVTTGTKLAVTVCQHQDDRVAVDLRFERTNHRTVIGTEVKSHADNIEIDGKSMHVMKIVRLDEIVVIDCKDGTRCEFEVRRVASSLTPPSVK